MSFSNLPIPVPDRALPDIDISKAEAAAGAKPAGEGAGAPDTATPHDHAKARDERKNFGVSSAFTAGGMRAMIEAAWAKAEEVASAVADGVTDRSGSMSSPASEIDEQRAPDRAGDALDAEAAKQRAFRDRIADVTGKVFAEDIGPATTRIDGQDVTIDVQDNDPADQGGLDQLGKAGDGNKVSRETMEALGVDPNRPQEVNAAIAKAAIATTVARDERKGATRSATKIEDAAPGASPAAAAAAAAKPNVRGTEDATLEDAKARIGEAAKKLDDFARSTIGDLAGG